MINALCIDLEYWYCNEFLKKYLPQQKPSQIIESVTPVLALLAKYNTRATFFVLGMVAEEHPEVVREIHKQGHEIGSHGYSHQPLHGLSRAEFEREISKTSKLLEAISGKTPIGFRAPSFSLDNSTKWALEVLREYGFQYDASIFPVKTNLYGVSGTPLHPYRISFEDVRKEDANSAIIEFPMTVFKAVANIPVAGGFYFRALPLWFTRLAFRRVNKTRPAIFYIHPWETYPQTPRKY